MTVSEIGDEVSGHDPDPIEPEDDLAIAGKTPWQLAWARLKRDKLALTSLAVIVALIVIAIFAPLINNAIGQQPNVPHFGPDGLADNGLPSGPSGTHLLGVDDEGRDVLARLITGSRISLFVGIVATAFEALLAIVVGVVAGFYGGKIDTLLSRFMDVVLSFPFLIMALALVTRFGAHLSITIGVIVFFSWSSLGRIVRGQVIALREREFVEAARSLGSSDLRIMFIDILPNLLAPVIVFGTLLIPVNIVFEATLSFLGLGVQLPTASWGGMLSTASGLYQQAWWFLVFPAIALLITTLAFNILGDGLRDALDPRFDRIIAK